MAVIISNSQSCDLYTWLSKLSCKNTLGIVQKVDFCCCFEETSVLSPTVNMSWLVQRGTRGLTPTELLSSDTSCSNESDTWNPYVSLIVLNNWKRVSTTSYRQPWVVEFFYRRYLPDLLDILLVRSMAQRKISAVMKNTPSRFFIETLAIAFIMIRSMIQVSFLEAKEIVWKSWGNDLSLILWHLTKSICIVGENRGNFSFSFSSWLWLQSR